MVAGGTLCFVVVLDQPSKCAEWGWSVRTREEYSAVELSRKTGCIPVLHHPRAKVSMKKGYWSGLQKERRGR